MTRDETNSPRAPTENTIEPRASTANVTLRKLEADVRRWLFAKEPAIAALRGIRRYRRAIEERTCIATLARAASTIDALARRPEPSLAALLDLAAHTAQLRGARAALARAEGALAALPVRSTIDSPLTDAQASALIDALDGRGERPTQVIVGALEQGRIADLRVLPWISKIVDGWVDDEIAVDVACAFGDDAAAKIEADFDRTGGRADVLRLRIIVAIRGSNALALVRRAYADGAAEMRASALEHRARLEPDAALRAAVDALDETRWKREFALWKAAITVSARARESDVALEALIGQLPFVNDTSLVLRDALAALAHPERSSRLLAAFAEAMAVLVEQSAERSQRGARQAHEDERSELDRFVREQQSLRTAWNAANAMSARLTPAFEAALFEAWSRRELPWNVREGIGAALLRTKREDIRASVIAEHDSPNFCIRELAMKMVVADPERSFESARPFFTASALAASDGRGVEKASMILSKLRHAHESTASRPDPRWSEHWQVALRFDALARDARQLLADWPGPAQGSSAR